MKGYAILLMYFYAASAWSESDDEIYDEDRMVEEINSLGSTWKAQRNFAPGTTYGDLKKLTGLKRKENEVTGNVGIQYQGSCEEYDLPRNFDARDKWGSICPSVTQIHDQGYCGSCWAVSVTSAFNDRYCIYNGGKDNVLLSSQQVTSCCETCTGGGEGCEGGYPIEAWKYISRIGVVSGGHYGSNEGCQPYLLKSCLHHVDDGKKYDIPDCKSLGDIVTPECEDTCYNNKYGTEFRMDKRKSKSTERLNYCDAMLSIYEEGPITAGFDVYLDFFSFGSGVYKHVIGKQVGAHAVRVIGWGEEENEPYWLVANSWNKYWGTNGTFKILRGINEVRFEDTLDAGVLHSNYFK